MSEKRTKRRGRGEGGVRYREDRKCWEGQVTLGYDPQTQKRVRRRVLRPTRKEVLAEMQRIKQEYERGHDASKLTLKEALTTWLSVARSRFSERTYSDRLSIFTRHVFPRLGDRVISTLSPMDIATFYGRCRDDGVKDATMFSIGMILNVGMNALVKMGVLESNPVARVDRPRLPDREMLCLDPAQCIILLSDASTCVVPPWFRALLHLAVASGCRVGELLAIRWPDLNRDACTLTIRRTLSQKRTGLFKDAFVIKDVKTRSSRRTIGIPRSVMDLVFKLQNDPFVFLTSSGKHPANADVNLKLDAVIGRANTNRGTTVIPAHLRFHDLRHTHASILLSSGMSVRAVSARLGHSSPSITLNTYAHVLPGDDARLVQKLDDVVFCGHRDATSNQ